VRTRKFVHVFALKEVFPVLKPKALFLALMAVLAGLGFALLVARQS
jgi:hypothetical protein